MSVRIGSNISSIISQRKLGEATGTLSKVYERLSSGQRINRASDDAAGLAIADSLNAKSRVFTQAIRNGNDGISYLNIADSAIAELSGIVVRIRELSEQSANGSYSNQQRKALDAEAQQLSKEFTRITQTTSFNAMKVFSAEGANVLLQLGDGANSTLNASIGGAVGTGEFNTPDSYTTESANNLAATLGDLNGDGILDLVTVGDSSSYVGQITIKLGTGNGSFGTATTYTSANATNYAVTLGDLNGDGVLDLVTVGYNNRVEVRLGSGDGSFSTATTYTLGSSANYAVTLGDLNGDGVLDLVTAGSNNRVEIRLGLGGGNFGTATTYTSGSLTNMATTLGDLNGDGILDLVTAGSSSRVEVRLGIGDGSFGIATTYTSGSSSNRAITLGDLNGDGILDLITAGNNRRVEVRIGMGDGSFGTATTYTSASASNHAVTLGDLNGDGILDLVTAGYEHRAEIRLGLGNGSFSAVTTYTSENTENYAVTLGDLNGDGVLDLVTAGYGSDTVKVNLAATENGLGALSLFSLKTRTDALQSMGMLDRTLQNLAKQRGTIGASLSRVEVSISNLQSATENFKAAESRIRDTDIASDAAELVRTQILQQAASAVLAQANRAPALALKLLR